MAGNHDVAMFVQNEAGERVQVGWASAKDESGVRTFEYSSGFETTRPRDVSFEDDELSMQVAEQQHEAREGDGSDGPEFEVVVNPDNNGELPLPEVPLTVIPGVTDRVDVEDEENDFVENNNDEEPTFVEPAAPIEDAPDPDAELADDQEELVELTTGGQIVDVEDDYEDVQDN